VPVVNRDLPIEVEERVLADGTIRKPVDRALNELKVHEGVYAFTTFIRGAVFNWILDPLDGSYDFGVTGAWSVHVALCERGVPAAAAVAVPAWGTTFATDPPSEPTMCRVGRRRVVVARSRGYSDGRMLAQRLDAEGHAALSGHAPACGIGVSKTEEARDAIALGGVPFGQGGPLLFRDDPETLQTVERCNAADAEVVREHRQVVKTEVLAAGRPPTLRAVDIAAVGDLPEGPTRSPLGQIVNEAADPADGEQEGGGEGVGPYFHERVLVLPAAQASLSVAVEEDVRVLVRQGEALAIEPVPPVDRNDHAGRVVHQGQAGHLAGHRRRHCPYALPLHQIQEVRQRL